MPRLLLVVAVVCVWLYVRILLNRRRHARSRAARPEDYLVNEAMLANRFGPLSEGPRGVAFRAFLARRQSGDELWCVHEHASDPRASTVHLVIVRPAAPGEPTEVVGDTRGRVVSKFQATAH